MLLRAATYGNCVGSASVIKEKLGIRKRYQELVVGVDLLCGNTNLSQFAPQELAKIMLVIVDTRACAVSGARGSHKMCARCRSAFYCCAG